MDWQRYLRPLVMIAIFVGGFFLFRQCIAVPGSAGETQAPRTTEIDYPTDTTGESPAEQGTEISLTGLVGQIKLGNVVRLKIGVGKAEASVIVDAETGGEKTFIVNFGTLEVGDVIPTLCSLGVTEAELAVVEIIYLSPPTNWGGIIGSLLPMLFFIGILVWFFRRSAGAGGGPGFDFGKSRAKRFSGTQTTVTFDDVGGLVEAKEELEEVVGFLKNPDKYITLGARVPKGVLLVGPPGCGKTLLARAVAGEASVPFFSISGSEFVEMFVGVGASRARDLFENAKRNTPCIVFIDEVESIGRQRGVGLGGSHEEREQTLNQIMVEMDGFEEHDTQIVVLAATNRPDMLDSAFLRPGRFDRRVVIDRPDRQARKAIFEVHLRGKPLALGLTCETLADKLAKLTALMTGADIESVVNEAAILAVRRGREDISMREFTEAIDRVVMGPERKSRKVIEKERKIVAYHEAGHAIVLRALSGCDPPAKVTIIPRWLAGGYVKPAPEEERTLYTKRELRDQIAGMFGGRASEELIFGKEGITGGAGSDLEQATKLARKMITRWAMGSDELGPQSFARVQEEDFLRELQLLESTLSEATRQLIDQEIRVLLKGAKDRAEEILNTYRDTLDAFAKELLAKETLEGEELKEILKKVKRE